MGIVPRSAIKSMSSEERRSAITTIESHIHERVNTALRREYERVAEELLLLGYQVTQSDMCLLDYFEQPDLDGERLFVQALSHIMPKVYFGKRKEGDPDFRTEYDLIVKSVQAEMDYSRRKALDVGYDRLTAREKSLFVIADLVAEVNNGGFSQYLTNSSGRHLEEASQACSHIGAKKTRALLEDVGKALREAGLLPDHSNMDEVVSRPRVSRSLLRFDKRFLDLNEHIHYLCWKSFTHP